MTDRDPIVGLHPNWKTMRRMADAVFEAIDDQAAELIADAMVEIDFESDLDDEVLHEAASDQVLRMLTYMLLPSDHHVANHLGEVYDLVASTAKPADQ